MKKIFFIITEFILIIMYMYTINITNMPDNIVLFGNEDIDFNLATGISLKEVTVEAATTLNEEVETKDIKKYQLNLSFLDKYIIKKINVDVISNSQVIPLGNSVGIKLYSAGVLVVGTAGITSDNNKIIKPFENSNILEGDLIVSINAKNIATTDELLSEIKLSEGNSIEIEYIRNGDLYKTTIQPAKTKDNEYKLGLWVRDSAAGVGTISFYEPQTQFYGALGHGITDVDTGELVSVAKGELTTTNVISIIKSSNGTPGEIKGSITNQKSLGDVKKNTKFGIYGNLTNVSELTDNTTNVVSVASRNEINIGEATVLCALDEERPKEYKVLVQKKYMNNNVNNKSMIIKVIDNELISKTGGIIQGMSGSPIIQNGKLIGALTHVFVSDPTLGYAVFGDLMVKQMHSQ